MAQILDPLPPDQSGNLLCCYINATSKIQIARSSNVPNWYFERVVFPGQRLVFEAPLGAVLEIHTGMMATAILSDNIPCERLVIQQESSSKDEVNEQSGKDEINKKPMMQAIKNKTEDTTKPLKVAGLA
jgi:hypothetical protein